MATFSRLNTFSDILGPAVSGLGWPDMAWAILCSDMFTLTAQPHREATRNVRRPRLKASRSLQGFSRSFKVPSRSPKGHQRSLQGWPEGRRPLCGSSKSIRLTCLCVTLALFGIVLLCHIMSDSGPRGTIEYCEDSAPRDCITESEGSHDSGDEEGNAKALQARIPTQRQNRTQQKPWVMRRKAAKA